MSEAPPSFVHLRLHSEFSLVDGIVRIQEAVSAARDAGMPAVAITDQSNLFGMVKFYRAALAAGVKPIIGADVWLADDTLELGYARMTLLCRDRGGYRALSRLLSRAYREGACGDIPVIRREWLQADAGGLLALSGGAQGDIGQALLRGDEATARRYLEQHRQTFGEDGFYLELHRLGRPGDERHLHAAVALAADEDVPVVATNDVRFMRPADYDAHEVRVCIHQGRTLDDPNRPRHYTEQQYFADAADMAERFSDLPEALETTLRIAERCSVDLELDTNYLPDFPVPEGHTVASFLRAESERGLAQRLEQRGLTEDEDTGEVEATYRQRLEHELAVIEQMGFPGYFLIVADFIRWARENDIPVGPGRGSGAGSLVAYALGITNLDPLRYDLLFERFLNPERVSMPDFDVDFCMERRDEVIEYVSDRYGAEKVSQIATHGTMAARAVVRDVGRVYGHAFGYMDRIAKLIPFEIGMTLDRALEQEEDLRAEYDNDENIRELIDTARSLEGMARNVGKHAGGVVIAPTDLTDFSPLYRDPEERDDAEAWKVATHFDKDDVEAVGLVKFDFLGLRTLTIIDWTVQAVNRILEQRGDPALDIDAIALDDGATFELLKRCATTAVFQLESRGMKELIKRLQPDSFEDIVALVALFRPGPLQSGMVDDFVERKHGRSAVAGYPTRELHHPDLVPVLQPTYGVILYQEQVQRIAQVLAGYSLGEADLLRRAMGKKKPEEMAKQRAKFLEGAKARGLSEDHATGIFDLMEKFAGYGFNKSHSAAYALLSYQTAWLKCHYPAPFMASVLSSDMDNTDKVVIFLDEARAMGLEVLPPDVNRSDKPFRAVDERTIVYGLGAIKGVGESALDAVLSERDTNGAFRDIFDLCRRVDTGRANRRVLEALCRSGSLDRLIPNRATGMAQIPAALAAAEQATRDQAAGQTDLFGGPAEAVIAPRGEGEEVAEQPEWPEEERLAAEKATLGLFLTGHPIDRYEHELPYLATDRLQRLSSGAGGNGGDGNGGRGRTVTAAGLVVALRVRSTSTGGRLATLTLDDRTGRIEVVLFPEAFGKYRHAVEKDALLVVRGSLDYDDFSGGYRITGEEVLDIARARERAAGRLVIPVTAARAANGLVPELRQVLSSYAGESPVHVDYRHPRGRGRVVLGRNWTVTPSDDLIKRLESVVDDRVGVEYPR
ncbi:MULTISPECIES: DNA polymerase III subunit alpha [unclassified Halorhodospira]|uniref:DNA polymerase III subunit alpha n=1 Tax=unclassified Halorhodospira TaxID=2626748 RepID=UPI001EE81398|nr:MULTISPECIES: DNA polymerase III subunit alpha [unclassified Halorhodospira]MCG5532195.1 DNA polymerase III subunit alpha [Halorhodospira sp. 9621]MCG5540480.1 DNA polymerase III subunit alpha [Halorhodospira sp. M39old]MCG5545024.1 DNA polymerase III subunit alpha [Halorhodospira sp. M38]